MTWDPEIPTHLLDDDESIYITETMAGAVDLDVEKVRLLVGQARLAHRRCLSAWRRRYDPKHKAPRSTGPYSKWENTQRGNPGRFRDGSNIPKPPLVAIYFLCNDWWRRELREPFWCDFRARHIGDDYERLEEKLEWINPAALFFLLIAQAVNELDYTMERCSLVHNLYYRKLNTKIPD